MTSIIVASFFVGYFTLAAMFCFSKMGDRMAWGSRILYSVFPLFAEVHNVMLQFNKHAIDTSKILVIVHVNRDNRLVVVKDLEVDYKDLKTISQSILEYSAHLKGMYETNPEGES